MGRLALASRGGIWAGTFTARDLLSNDPCFRDDLGDDATTSRVPQRCGRQAE